MLARLLDDAAGGRRRVVLLLAGFLAINNADLAATGAVANELERHLALSNLQLGLVLSVSLAVSGVATIPIGLLTDRFKRVPILVVSAVLWSAALVATGASTSFAMLLVSRMALGAVTATAGPTLASLIGDYFPPRDRAKVYGTILSGELVGAGAGFLVSGEIAAVLSWRFGYWVLVIPGLVLAWLLARKLPEPPRGGGRGDEDPGHARDGVVDRAVRKQGTEPRPGLVLDRDPVGMSLRSAVRYVLSVRTNLLLIVVSALGYFFFAGVRAFGVIYLRGHFGLGQATATALIGLVGIGALIGVLTGGRVADRLVRRGRVNGRVLVASVAYAVTPLLVAPAIYSSMLVVSIPLLFGGALSLSAANPPVDAGRLDIMHSRLWGRAEGVRTVFRTCSEAGAPVLFGFVSSLFGAALSFGARHVGTRAAEVNAHGLEYTYLIMLIPLIVSAVLAFRTLRSYPRDVATAVESERRTAERARQAADPHRRDQRPAGSRAGSRRRVPQP